MLSLSKHGTHGRNRAATLAPHGPHRHNRGPFRPPAKFT
jgi:hypothetical protein